MRARIISIATPTKRAATLRRRANARRCEATQLRLLGEEDAASSRLADAKALDAESSRIERHQVRVYEERRKVAGALTSVLERIHAQRRREGLEDETGRELPDVG